MHNTDRRTFLKLIGSSSLAAAMPVDLSRALAIPAHNRTGSIADVEHIIVLMQENRSFDHYFGMLRGVRGFSDPRAVKLPSGDPVWHQPDGAGKVILPFRPNVQDLGQTFLPDPPHGWNDTHGAWNGGRYDQWIPQKLVASMTYHTRKDLPWQYALADAFTICDNYHCSLLGPTDPNRYHMWTGWVGNDGQNGGPVITNAELGYDWSTYPERLERAGISWKIYQDIGDGLDAPGSWGWTGNDPFMGNYGDNSLLYFHQYQNALPGTPLADRAKVGTNIKKFAQDPLRLMDMFREDVESGKLPKVSWIVAPESYSEHPNWEPDFGTWYVSQVFNILASNPEVWSKMALFITYDEEGGFFDHLVPPTPPQSRAEGLSTVPITNEIFEGDAVHPAAPYGLGIRVPMLIVSPWTRGGWVNSQLFDHTSLIRFLEARFAHHKPDLIESNITPWRRAVVGDLTSAFDFKTPNASPRFSLPDTDDLKPIDLVFHDDEVPVPPTNPHVPKQEPGVRPARALPYELRSHGLLDEADRSFQVHFHNSGEAAAVFQVRSSNAAQAPRTYTVESNEQLADSWSIGASDYDLSAYGPNGFFRSFKGGVSGPRRANLDIREQYDGSTIELTIVNRASQIAIVHVVNRYSSRSTQIVLGPGESDSGRWSLVRTSGWYDLAISVQGDAQFACQFAGHVEDGQDSISDPLMGGLI